VVTSPPPAQSMVEEIVVQSSSQTGVRNRTDIPTYLLHDIEAGDLWPSALHLHRLAAAFAVPLPMLVDDKATPLRVLRLLSGQTA
jgi:hypothetical protein